jgi:hypothetical protein
MAMASGRFSLSNGWRFLSGPNGAAETTEPANNEPVPNAIFLTKLLLSKVNEFMPLKWKLWLLFLFGA